MPKLKVPRKSTSIDMTAMCDVAFLLLSFFIFTAKMKKSTEIEVENPTSVSTDTLAVQNKYNVTINIGKEGQVLVGLDNDSMMKVLGKKLDTLKGYQFTGAELDAFAKRTSIGMDFNAIKKFASTAATGGETGPQPGIPLPKTGVDSANNQLSEWFDLVGWKMFYEAKAANPNITDPFPVIYINADKKAPWAVVDQVMTTFAKLKLDKFKLVTTPEDVPMGTALYKELQDLNKEAAKQ